MSPDFNQYDASRNYGAQAPVGSTQWAMEQAARKKQKESGRKPERADEDDLGEQGRRSWFRRR